MKRKTILFYILIVFLIIIIGYFFIGTAPKAKNITFGVNFSQKHAQDLGLEWKENYLALLDNLKVRDIKLISHWDLIEREKDKFYFDDLDWQIKEAEKRDANIILVIGMKTGRWPECHIPEWAKKLNKKEQQERILKLIKEIILRYQDSTAIWAWQVENEPLFPFGECPWTDREFLEREIRLVKSINFQKKLLILTDSGEGSFWITSARLGDIMGITMYKKVWVSQLKIYVYYPLPPVFYWRKAVLIKKIFNKKVIVTELQAEPWGPKLLYDTSPEEQEKTMNLDRFKYNINFAKETGFDKFYLWGAEWWYWLKEKQDKPEIWLEAKGLFK
ncbi:MAG: hypothetical protein ACKKMV_00475 [Candidatus Nealsonbacteria bacterium]|nr:MAG: hypothetical protein IB617_01415 [Candidatus Nealsonbacteria bacterium]